MPKASKISQIIQIATKHFASAGYEGARMDEIAGEAQVNKATIYYQIGNKEALYEMVLVKIIDRVLKAIEYNIELSENPEEQLLIFASEFAMSLQNHPDVAPLILREIASGGNHMNDDALKKMHQIRELLLKILENGEEQKVFKACNPFLIHILLVGTLNFYAASASIRDKLYKTTTESNEAFVTPVTSIAEEVVNLILNSIRLTVKE